MPGQKNPFDINRLKKEGIILKDDKFYELLSEAWNHLEPETVKQFYLAFVKIVSRQIRTKGVIRLPHLGDYALVKQPANRVQHAGRGRSIPPRDDVYALRFYPDYKLKAYFSKHVNRSGEKDMLDPREKLFNRKLVGTEGKMTGF